MSTVAAGPQTARDPAGPGGLRWRIARLEDENAGLRDQQQRLERERERLRAEVEALRRAAKRQAAPFSKGNPTPTPRRAGRKPGVAHGTRAHRHPPEHIDRVVAVGLPACCPGCGGALALERVATQHVEDLPAARPLVTRFEVQVGRCRAGGGSSPATRSRLPVRWARPAPN